jgi:hypothetical protein
MTQQPHRKVLVLRLGHLPACPGRIELGSNFRGNVGQFSQKRLGRFPQTDDVAGSGLLDQDLADGPVGAALLPFKTTPDANPRIKIARRLGKGVDQRGLPNAGLACHDHYLTVAGPDLAQQLSQAGKLVVSPDKCGSIESGSIHHSGKPLRTNQAIG